MEVKVQTRRHGLEKPFHPLQILSWAISIYMILVLCLLILPVYLNSQSIICSILFAILTFSYISSGFIASLSDPSDPAILQFKLCKDEK